MRVVDSQCKQWNGCEYLTPYQGVTIILVYVLQHSQGYIDQRALFVSGN